MILEKTISKIGCGCGYIHKKGFKYGVELIQQAIDSGVTYIDVASSYPDKENYGLNEKIVGEAIKGYEEKIFVATKVLARDYKGAKEEIKGSLKKLNKIDLLQLHSVDTVEVVDFVFKENGALRALIEARNKGLVKYIGITNHHDPKTLDAALRKFDFDTLMLPMGVLNELMGQELERKGEINFRKIAREYIQKNKLVLGMLILGAGIMKKNIDLAIRFGLEEPLSVMLLGFSDKKEISQSLKILEEWKMGKRLTKEELTKLFSYGQEVIKNKKLWWREAPIGL